MNGDNTRQRTVEDYFPKELMEQFNEMSNDEMKSLLLELSSTRLWIAIMKYLHDRKMMAQNGLFTLDPFKDQTAMARYQGIITGMLDLPEGILTLKDIASNPVDKKIKKTSGAY